MRCKKNIILSLEILISFYRNIISHLTEKVKIITLSLVIIMLSFANIALCSSNIFNNSNVSALDYSSNVGIGFTFNPTLSVNISPNDLIIPNLAPGTTSDSNIINVSVATNASHGYTLSATVGDSLHNNTNLTHANNTDIFSSIAMDANLANLTTDNTWGYSYKNNIATTPTWSSYSGLSNSASKVLFNTDNNSSSSVDFKIAAKASETQPSGIYTGTINFAATTKPIPKTIDDIAYMQTFAELDAVDLASVKSSMTLNSAYMLKDIRDEKEYYVTRLEDGNVWMTQNLDLDLSHDRPLTSNDTDLNDSSLSGAYSVGYTYDTSDNIISWTPKNTTRDYQNNTGTAWVNNNNMAYSLDPGEWYWDGDDSGTTACNYLTTACDHFSQTQSETNTHLSIGNYYNWSATIASDNGSSLTASTYNDVTLNPQNSICPKGWRLPTISSQSNIVSGSTNEFARLNYLYNSGATNTDIRLISSPLWFVRAGLVSSNGNLVYSGSGTGYWPSTVYGSGQAYYLDFSATNVNPTNHVNMFFGRSVRCVAR